MPSNFATRTLTADLCDKYDNARVVPGPFVNFGSRHACIGRVELVSTQDDNSLVSAALKEPGNNQVLVVDNSASTACAMVGGDLARSAHANGWQGIVVNGAIRDVVELANVPIAIFARSACPRKSEKRGIGVRGKPIDLAGIVVHRGDIAAADPDGVIVIRAEDFEATQVFA